MNTILLYLIFSVTFNLLMFVPAFLFKTDKLTDLSYSITFFVIAILLFISNPMTLPSALLTAMVLIWAVRLGSYLFMRIQKTKRDKRFDGMRESFPRFMRFWILQGISVWVIMLSSIFFSEYQVGELNVVMIAGFIIWLTGILIETFADIQKFKFKGNPDNSGKWIESGLWKYSRHPNYLGEILVWAGIYVFVLCSLSGIDTLISLVSPLYIFIIIRFLTGVPILEKKADEKWSANPEYQNYKEKTGLLLLKFPRKTLTK